MTPSQRGRLNRNRGHDWERECARHMSAELALDVVSARSISGGTAVGADLVTVHERDPAGRPTRFDATVHGWAIELKTGEPHKPTPWLRQAKSQADSGLYAVVAKRDRQPTHAATVYVPPSAAYWWLTARSGYECGVPFWSLSLSAFVALLELGDWEADHAA